MALAVALQRYGVPADFVDMVSAIYAQRNFVVRDAGETSTWHSQAFGISQGCPLSPFLFVMVMTVLLHDAKHKLVNTMGVQLHDASFANELVYADDTLLLDIDADVLHAFMLTIGSVGEEYGLKFNWKKLEMMPVRVDAVIRTPDGDQVKCKDQLVYLGSSLSSDGKVGSELNRRLGLARADYENLRKIWSHSALSVRRKVAVFEACVVSKLLYGLTSACLNKCEKRRIDGFQARCLRKIMKVAPAYWSRVSNQTVLARASSRPVSQQLLKHQLIYFGRIASRNPTDPVRDSILKREGVELRELQETR